MMEEQESCIAALRSLVAKGVLLIVGSAVFVRFRVGLN